MSLALQADYLLSEPPGRPLKQKDGEATLTPIPGTLPLVFSLPETSQTQSFLSLASIPNGLSVFDDGSMLYHMFVKIQISRDFPGDPVDTTLRSHCRRPGFNPWSGN